MSNQHEWQGPAYEYGVTWGPLSREAAETDVRQQLRRVSRGEASVVVLDPEVARTLVAKQG